MTTIEGTAQTPMIKFDSATGKIEIKGRSIPDNPIEFYKPLNEWLDKYEKTPIKFTEIHIYLDYFNTRTAKCIYEIFKKFETIVKNGHDVLINWYYEEYDEDMLEAGEDYQSMVMVPFKMIKIDD